jgi:hypothetical protein
MPRKTRATDKPGPLSTALKWIGGITAVISLLLGLNQVTGLVQKFRIHRKEFSETMKAAEQQMGRADYPAAFATLKHAVELDPIDSEAQTREAEAAMRWLENVHAQERTFTETANQLLPVLDNALTTAQGPEAADLLAHIGWANFLKYRDGQREGVTVEENYKKALDVEAGNVYAHAMWGHWSLWQGGSLDEATRHFAAALASGRVRPFVRMLQISALANRGRDADLESLRVSNDMRKNGESLNEHDRDYILWANFTTKYRDRQELLRGISVMSAAEMEGTYDWLAEGLSEDKVWTRDFVIANLREAAGNHTEALNLYTSLQKTLRGTGHTLIPYVEESIKRVKTAAH